MQLPSMLCKETRDSLEGKKNPKNLSTGLLHLTVRCYYFQSYIQELHTLSTLISSVQKFNTQDAVQLQEPEH